MSVGVGGKTHRSGTVSPPSRVARCSCWWLSARARAGGCAPILLLRRPPELLASSSTTRTTCAGCRGRRRHPRRSSSCRALLQRERGAGQGARAKLGLAARSSEAVGPSAARDAQSAHNGYHAVKLGAAVPGVSGGGPAERAGSVPLPKLSGALLVRRQVHVQPPARCGGRGGAGVSSR